MAVASAARPDYETSMYRVQIPSVTSFGWRNRSVSVDRQGTVLLVFVRQRAVAVNVPSCS
ncbi:hypothetical protein Pcac1_g17868 [Phytophthora cactorum]|nr:hypothetical protein Pcac1_g17868 [Phytophthora cactorum]